MPLCVLETKKKNKVVLNRQDAVLDQQTVKCERLCEGLWINNKHTMCGDISSDSWRGDGHSHSHFSAKTAFKWLQPCKSIPLYNSPYPNRSHSGSSCTSLQQNTAFILHWPFSSSLSLTDPSSFFFFFNYHFRPWIELDLSVTITTDIVV